MDAVRLGGGSGYLCLAEGQRRGHKPLSPALGVPSWPELSCCLPVVLECTVLLCHGASNRGTFLRCWGMLGLAGRREWMLRDQPGWDTCCGVGYGCRAASTGLHSPSPPCVYPRPGASLMPGEWALAQRCCLTSVPGSAERVRGGSLCREAFQTFALGKGPFSISVFVGLEVDQAPQHAPSPPLPASGPHRSILPVKPLMPWEIQAACPGLLRA